MNIFMHLRKKATFLLLFISLLAPLNAHETVGKKLGQASFLLGALASSAVLAGKYKIAFGLSTLALGSLFIAPVIDEYFEDEPHQSLREYKKTLYIASAAIVGFTLLTIGMNHTADGLFRSHA